LNGMLRSELRAIKNSFGSDILLHMLEATVKIEFGYVKETGWFCVYSEITV